jgi:cobaltochelatase CobS
MNPKTLKVADVLNALDIIETERLADGAAEESVAVDAVVELRTALEKIGYSMAAQTETLVRNHRAKRAKNGTPRVTAATAGDNAVAIATDALGHSPRATEKKNGPETKATSMIDEAKTEGTIKVDAAETENPFAAITKTSAWTKDMIEAIDTALQQVTAGRIRSIVAIIDGIVEAENTVAAQNVAKAWGEAKLKAYRDGDVETAESVAFEPPSFKPSGIQVDSFAHPMMKVLDQLLASSSGNKLTGLDRALATLDAAEKLAAKQAGELRSLARDIRAAAPKIRIAVSGNETENDDGLRLDCEVVMRKAADVFAGNFGAVPALLDFEIPTLEWAEENPDVPKIDPSFRFYDKVLADALDCVGNNEICWLYGESGCGKSEFWMQIAARTGFPVFRLNMDSHLSRADLVGTNRLIANPETKAPEMRFIEGLIPRALRVPSILLIDEMDLGDPEVMPVLQPILEGNGIRILEDKGRMVNPHPWSRIAITANTIGLGSQNMMYINAHEQSAATRDRIARYVEMPYLPADKELEVVMARVPDADQTFAAKVIKLANKVREGYRMGEIHQVFSTRTVLRAIRRHARFSPLYQDEKAAAASTIEVVVLNRCDPNSRSVVTGMVDAIF